MSQDKPKSQIEEFIDSIDKKFNENRRFLAKAASWVKYSNESLARARHETTLTLERIRLSQLRKLNSLDVQVVETAAETKFVWKS